MLAGAVQVSISDSVMTVIGDQLDNQIQISQNASGNLVVAGADTTVNGGTQFVAPQAVNYLTVLVEGGNDTVDIDSVSLRRNISLYGRDGNDQFNINNSSAYYFHGEGEAGDDVFQINMNVAKSAYL